MLVVTAPAVEGKKVTRVLGACVLLVLAACAGCRQHRDPGGTGPVVIVDFDWRGWTTGTSFYRLRHPGFEDGSPFAERHARHSYGAEAETRTIHGSRYSEMRAFASAEPGNFWWYFTIAVGDIDDREQRADIRLRTEVQCKLEITSFDHGVLRNADTGEVLTPPFILDPGEYHLEATAAEKGTLGHGVPEAAGKPSQAN